jgi:hypothetical protein
VNSHSGTALIPVFHSLTTTTPIGLVDMKPRNKGLYEQLVKSRARGETIAHFCKRTGAPVGTANRWSQSDELRARVDAIHRSWDSDFRSRNARQISAAQKMIYELSQRGSELTRLKASERIIDDRQKARDADIERQLSELRALIEAKGATDAAR